MHIRLGRVLSLAALALSGLGCSDEATKVVDQHKVYFVGYVYDGARGVRLGKVNVGSVSIRYRDQIIAAEIEADGRFVTKDPLPTWQDYAVTIVAEGYRTFVSRNAGLDVPASLAMTDGLAGAATTQTFHYDAHLFPVGLKAPKLAFTIEQADELATSIQGMPAVRASGSIRLRPESTSLLESASTTTNPVTGATISPRVRRWPNDEDLLNQTISRAFTEGRVEFAEGELVYGVNYQVAIFDVRGYQPLVLSGQQGILAGGLTSRTVVIQREQREPLRIVSSNAASCMPPAGSSTEYGAAIKLVFNEPVEAASTTLAEDIDNGVAIAPTGFSTGSGSYCALKENRDPLLQERGTRVTIEGSSLTLAFNPSVGINAITPSCLIPTTLTSVAYGNLQSVFLRPMGDTNPTRRRSLSAMVAEHQQSQGTSSGSTTLGSLTCPARF
jgi:hypothetical protein